MQIPLDLLEKVVRALKESEHTEKGVTSTSDIQLIRRRLSGVGGSRVISVKCQAVRPHGAPAEN